MPRMRTMSTGKTQTGKLPANDGVRIVSSSPRPLRKRSKAQRLPTMRQSGNNKRIKGKKKNEENKVFAKKRAVSENAWGHLAEERKR